MKDRRISMGPCPVPTYPVTAFSGIPGKRLDDLWRLVGPTVERNIDQPLWKQFCAVYYEGLSHGAGAERERTHDLDGEGHPPDCQCRWCKVPDDVLNPPDRRQ